MNWPRDESTGERPIPDLGGSASVAAFAVLLPEHRQPVVVEVVDHRQPEAAGVAEVVKLARPVNGAAQTRVGVGLTAAGQARVLVEDARQRAVHAEQFCRPARTPQPPHTDSACQPVYSPDRPTNYMSCLFKFA